MIASDPRFPPCLAAGELTWLIRVFDDVVVFTPDKQMKLHIMATTFYTLLAVIVALGAITYLFVIEPRSKVHDL
jgi:hypothetical protein